MLLTITPRLHAVGLPRRFSIRWSVFSPKPVCRASSLNVISGWTKSRRRRLLPLLAESHGAGAPWAQAGTLALPEVHETTSYASATGAATDFVYN